MVVGWFEDGCRWISSRTARPTILLCFTTFSVLAATFIFLLSFHGTDIHASSLPLLLFPDNSIPPLHNLSNKPAEQLLHTPSVFGTNFKELHARLKAGL